jgi:SAM-dependent methyltransferase
MSTIDRGWTDYWQHEGDGGEVFVNAKGERHPALAKFWASVFDGISASAAVVDLASGAGSIFAHLPADHGFRLHAADISEEALEALATRIPGVATSVCSADSLPYTDGQFDLVVSQFGIEYAGQAAFIEAARVVAKGGHLHCLCHARDGYIDSKNKGQLDAATDISESGFIKLCRDLAITGFGSNATAMQASEAAFIPVAKRVAESVQRTPVGVHSHLYQGFRQLFEDRRDYDLADITGWLDGMQLEVDRAIDRLTRMRAAALSAPDVAELTENLKTAGLHQIQFDLFTTPGNELPVAWSLSAMRLA